MPRSDNISHNFLDSASKRSNKSQKALSLVKERGVMKD